MLKSGDREATVIASENPHQRQDVVGDPALRHLHFPADDLPITGGRIIERGEGGFPRTLCGHIAFLLIMLNSRWLPRVEFAAKGSIDRAYVRRHLTRNKSCHSTELG